MKDKRIFAFLAHINMNMWNDPNRSDFQVLTPEQRDSLFQDPCVDWELWDDMLAFLPKNGFNMLLVDIGNGVKYERHPELWVRSSIDKDEMKKRIADIRAAGLVPIPKLNFSAGHGAWLCEYKCKVGTPEYYRTCLDCLDEIAELFDYPEYFHLGLDEEVYWELGHINVRSPRVFWNDAAKLFDRCGHHNMRPWIWADAYWHNPVDFLKYVPKSVLLSNWFYEPCKGMDENGNYKQVPPRAYIELDKRGYDQVPTGSTWNTERNLDFTMKLAATELDPIRMKGVMTAPWVPNMGDKYLIIKQEAVRFGSAKKKYFTEEGEIRG